MKRVFDYFKKSKKPNKIGWILFVVSTFVVGLVASIFLYNYQEKDRNATFEVTFLDPHQAIVFWTTEQKTIGFIKYGEEENTLDQEIYQTSSEPGTVHAVVVENIPLEGGYISLHNESESPFLFTQVQRIVFDATTYLE